jgi:hypothetical protein
MVTVVAAVVFGTVGAYLGNRFRVPAGILTWTLVGVAGAVGGGGALLGLPQVPTPPGINELLQVSLRMLVGLRMSRDELHAGARFGACRSDHDDLNLYRDHHCPRRRFPYLHRRRHGRVRRRFGRPDRDECGEFELRRRWGCRCLRATGQGPSDYHGGRRPAVVARAQR